MRRAVNAGKGLAYVGKMEGGRQILSFVEVG